MVRTELDVGSVMIELCALGKAEIFKGGGGLPRSEVHVPRADCLPGNQICYVSIFWNECWNSCDVVGGIAFIGKIGNDASTCVKIVILVVMWLVIRWQ